MRIYTKTGDEGTTALAGGRRVPKNDARVEAYGTVDELAAQLAMLGDLMTRATGFEDITEDIEAIQKDLMVVEARLAGAEMSPVEGAVEWLEARIDVLSEDLPAIGGFILPGGHVIASQCNICRTVCRRSERAAVTADMPQNYLNRLSDWLYVVGRETMRRLGVNENYWSGRKNLED